MNEEILKYIFGKNAAQQKRIENAFSSYPEMKSDFENFLRRYEPFMKKRSITLKDLANAYLLLVKQMLISRIEFMRSGRYPLSSTNEVLRNIDSTEKGMVQYMLGLAISQFLWIQHYKIFKFYKSAISAPANRRKALEVGSGHGLFTIEFLNSIKDLDFMDIVDISETSLLITKDIIQELSPGKIGYINFIKKDVCDFFSDKVYNFITMGEVLEHVNDPLRVLGILHCLLADDGRIFVSTCANSPAIDHRFHFKSVKHIRDMIVEARFEVVKELVINSEDLSDVEIERLKLDVLYAAELKKII